MTHVRRGGPGRRRSSARRWAASSPTTTTGGGSSTSTSRSAASASLPATSLLEDPDYLEEGAGRAAATATQFRLHRPGAAGHGHVLLGSRAQQRAAMGLVRRSRSGACRRCWSCSCSGLVVPGRPGDADRQSGGQLSPAGASAISRSAASSSFAPTACSTPPARRCRACCRRCSATTPIVSGLVHVAVRALFGHRCCWSSGVLLGRGVDARWLIARGLAGHGGRQLLDVANEPGDQPLAGGLAAGGADRRLVADLRPDQRGRLYVHPATLRGAAVGLFACSATKGAASARRWPKPSTSAANSSTSRAGRETSIRLNPDVQSFLDQGQTFFIQQTGDAAASQQMACKALADLRQQQASSLAYFDVFWLCAVVALALVLLVLLHETLGGRKGAHVGAE